MKTENKDLVRAWVDVMRDPNTRQTFGSLRNRQDAVCALGALCNAAETLGLGRWVGGPAEDAAWRFEVRGQRGESNYPPSELMSLFEDEGVPLEYNGRLRFVYSLNDSVRLPLPEIADLVEEQYL